MAKPKKGRAVSEVHVLGAYVHGALTALHVLGLGYNVRRRNWTDVALHLAWVVYDARAMRHHWRQASCRS